MKTRETVEGFHLLENSHKLCQGFHQAMKAWRLTCFISFIKLVFSDSTRERRHTKRVCIALFLSRNCKFSQLGDSQSYRSNHFHSLHQTRLYYALPKTRRNYGIFSMKFTGAKIWNQIDKHIQVKTNDKSWTFRRHLFAIVKEN